ncbi:Abi-alpha family protein [Hymenobacter guriensis]|nr:Abi-alpha family protein [Hymenobacter guriensis]
MLNELNELDIMYKLAIGSSPVVVPFLNKILGPTGDEIGKFVLSRLKLLPIIKQVQLYSKADAMLKDSGVVPHQVESKILLPLVEAASLEEDDSLFNKWAALLANAAVYQTGAIQPAFVEVLKQLTPRQAYMLDTLFRLAPGDLPPSQPTIFGAFTPRPFGFEAYMKEVGAYGNVEGEINQDAYNATFLDLDNLFRLRLFIGPDNMIATKSITEKRARIGYSSKTLALTHFGHSFIVACQPPTSE